MVRYYDAFDELLTNHIEANPGITFAQLLDLLRIPSSTLRYRLITLQLEGIIGVKKTRNANAYFLSNSEGGDRL